MAGPEQNEFTPAQNNSSPPTESGTAPSNSPPSSGPDESTPPGDNDATIENDTKRDDSGEDVDTDDKKADSQNGKQDGQNAKQPPISHAMLYCPNNGVLHSGLLNFGIMNCPLCLQSLARLEPLRAPPPHRPGPPLRIPGPPYHRRYDSDNNSNSDLDGSDDDTDESENERERIPRHLKIDHEIEYRDIGNNPIKNKYWGRRFEFERERNRALKRGSAKRESVFRTVTVLRTSLPADKHRTEWQTERLRNQCFVGNSQISLAVQYTKIIILSGLFMDALKSVVSYETPDLESSEFHLGEPFSVISHHLDELEDYVRRIDDRSRIADTAGSDAKKEMNSVERETRIHVGLVLDFVKSILKDTIDQERARHNQDVPVCTYRMMWYLIRPGDVVYVMSDDTADAYVVADVEMDSFSLSSADINTPCFINLWYLNFNGTYITRARSGAAIKPFRGEVPITSLEVVPCRIWDKADGGKLRAKLEERGKKWVDHLPGKQVNYQGEPSRPGRKMVDGRGYVDPTSFYSEGNRPDFSRFETRRARPGPRGPHGGGGGGPPRYGPGPPPRYHSPPPPPPPFVDWSDSDDSANFDSRPRRTEKPQLLRKSGATYDNLSINNIGGFVDDLGRRIGYLLCCRQLKGFVFRTRSWETLDVRYCEPVKPDKNPFARLVMPNERKMMIKALVYKYTDPKYAGDVSQVWGADFIRNKGEGQIFLLHGGPGVGKTFTAECIAEFTGRPLLALTCGDIGTEEVEMEEKLRHWLELAYKWGAVMLIDEADVFLEKRQDSDLKRNSLVSVFLREIEYYRGILFLTSNRVGKFDDAIVSRIHVVIHYKGLDDEYRKKIWNQFFDKLAKERGATINIENSARRYVLENKRMAEMKWNGREIRNAFQTAVALAEYRFLTKPQTEKEDGEIAVLEEEDFEEICDMTIRFKEYLKAVNEGQDEETRAVLDRARV